MEKVKNPTETLLRVPSRCQQAGPARTWPRERRTLPTWWAEQCVDGCGAVHPWSWRTVVARCRLLEPEVQNDNARTSTANQLTKLSLLYMIFMNSKKNIQLGCAPFSTIWSHRFEHWKNIHMQTSQ